MDLAPWHDFAVAAVGVSGALVGLLFVALSLNLDFILSHRHLPARGATAMTILMAVVLLNLCLLVPGQSATELGVEAGVIGGAILIRALLTGLATYRRRSVSDPWAWTVQPLAINLLPGLAATAAATDLVGSGHRVGLFAVTTVVGLLAAIWEAWVLLIEIRR